MLHKKEAMLKRLRAARAAKVTLVPSPVSLYCPAPINGTLLAAYMVPCRAILTEMKVLCRRTDAKLALIHRSGDTTSSTAVTVKAYELTDVPGVLMAQPGDVIELVGEAEDLLVSFLIVPGAEYNVREQVDGSATAERVIDEGTEAGGVGPS